MSDIALVRVTDDTKKRLHPILKVELYRIQRKGSHFGEFHLNICVCYIRYFYARTLSVQFLASSIREVQHSKISEVQTLQPRAGHEINWRRDHKRCFSKRVGKASSLTILFNRFG